MTNMTEPGRSGAVDSPRSGSTAHRGDQVSSGFDWAGLAAQLARFEGLANKIQKQHLPDHTGHCRTCAQLQNGYAPVHPCRLRDVADLALALTQRKVPS